MSWLAGILGRSTRRPAAPRQLQVRARYDALNIARYGAFLNPRLVPV